MKKSESIVELAKALSAFQGEVKQPFKDKANPFFKSKYVPLENVVEAISETASKHGLSYMQFPINQDDKVGIVTLIMHSSGEWIESEPIFAKPAKNDPQATGSVITYLKRYSLSAVFGITSDEDDDGEKAMNRAEQQGQKQSYQTQYKPKQQNNAQISSPQLKAIHAKTKNIANDNGMDAGMIYNSALIAIGLPEGISSKELTKEQASKLISYLSDLEPVKS